MGRKVKYSPEEKICAVNEYLAGKRLQRNLGVLTPMEKYKSYKEAA